MHYFLIIFLALASFLSAKTVCLNMVVKNESGVIERCLNAVKDQIDYWVIVDMGSTDGTQDIIKKCLKGKKGEIHQKTFVNYGYNKSEAFELAKSKADYVLFVDADDIVKFDTSFDKNNLSEPYYFVFCLENTGHSNKKVALVHSKKAWK
jgi:glycosyltransferase involved in cell wall biosynthesis